MKEQGTLSASQPRMHWVTGFTPDTLLVHNYTTWPVYLRLGDTLDAGPTSYHLIIPPATAVVLPVSSPAFAAALGIPVPGTALVGNERVDLLWTANESAPASAQYSLLAQPSTQFGFNLTAGNPNAVFQFDVAGYPSYGISIIPQPNSQGISVAVDISHDAITWSQEWSGQIVPGGISMVRFFPTVARYMRVVLSRFLGDVTGTFSFVLAPEQPDNASFAEQTDSTVRNLLVPGANLPYSFSQNFHVGRGTLTHFHIQLLNFPLTATRREPFVWIAFKSPFTANKATVFMQSIRLVSTSTSAAMLADRLAKEYNAKMTLQSVSYMWRPNLHIIQGLWWELHVEGPDGAVIALDATARIHYALQYEQDI